MINKRKMEIDENNDKNEMLRELSKVLGEEEYFLEKAMITYKEQQEKCYTFFRDDDTNIFLQKYNLCQRPEDTNMSLRRFDSNGEVCGYMSESLAEKFNLKKIDLNEFIHKFVKPIIKENLILKRKNEQKDNQIDLMINFMYETWCKYPGTISHVLRKNGFNDDKCGTCENTDRNCIKCLKEYFETKTKEKGE